ncbi:unnamed protein product [Withania somnifera]
MASSSLPLSFHIITSNLHNTTTAPKFFPLHNASSSLSVSHICYSSSPDREESRWLREESRWLREEQRWLREERRWEDERAALLMKIQELQLRVKELESKDRESIVVPEGSVIEALSEIAKLLKEQLLKLGFYCGEEDLEFSSFSGGTERAVKTWQASSGVREDGIMTSELLEKLFMVQSIDIVKENPKQPDGAEAKRNANGSPVASIMEIEEVQQTIAEDDGVSETDFSHHRVFLLGENRWEEPSRLATNKKLDSTSGSTTVKCLTCRGEGRLLCMECDGTGEPNIEEQFMEWIDEGMKCPYCEGHGFVTCDVCEGKKMVQA